jgi:hypothetical protein
MEAASSSIRTSRRQCLLLRARRVRPPDGGSDHRGVRRNAQTKGERRADTWRTLRSVDIGPVRSRRQVFQELDRRLDLVWVGSQAHVVCGCTFEGSCLRAS